MNDRKKEKSVVSFTHEQNITCSQTHLDDIAQEQTIICRQLFSGHLVGFRPMKRKKKLHQMIIQIFCLFYHRLWGFFLAVLTLPLFCQVKLSGTCASLRCRCHLTPVSIVCVSYPCSGPSKDSTNYRESITNFLSS